MNVVTDQKWFNIYEMMLKPLQPFNGNGHCVVCDSAYMGDIIIIAEVSHGTNRGLIGWEQYNQTERVLRLNQHVIE